MMAGQSDSIQFTNPFTSRLQYTNSRTISPAGNSRSIGPTTFSNNTYLLPTSPMKGGRTPTSQAVRPSILRTSGQKPACLVNASVTYCGNNQIYAFGGFDQYTDEGLI
jgi:hypothetical protein